MPKYNTNFELNVRDLELIEQALFLLQEQQPEEEKIEVLKLRGKLHNQKVWYIPDENVPQCG